MFKLFGIMAILASAVLFIYEIKRKANALFLMENEVIRLIRHIRKRIECYLSPIGEWCLDFSSDELTSCGMICDGKIADAEYFLSDKRLLMLHDERRMLYDFFGEAGGTYLSNEIERIKKLEEDFCAAHEKNLEQLPRRVKCYSVIAASVAVGASILFV